MMKADAVKASFHLMVARSQHKKKWHYSRILMRRRRSGYATMAFELAIVAYIFSCVYATTTELAVFRGTKYMRTII